MRLDDATRRAEKVVRALGMELPVDTWRAPSCMVGDTQCIWRVSAAVLGMAGHVRAVDTFEAFPVPLVMDTQIVFDALAVRSVPPAAHAIVQALENSLRSTPDFQSVAGLPEIVHRILKSHLLPAFVGSEVSRPHPPPTHNLFSLFCRDCFEELVTE
jgi:hypothetical protein